MNYDPDEFISAEQVFGWIDVAYLVSWGVVIFFCVGLFFWARENWTTLVSWIGGM